MNISKNEAGVYQAQFDDGRVELLSASSFRLDLIQNLNAKSPFKLSTASKQPVIQLRRGSAGELLLTLGAFHLGHFKPSNNLQQVVEINGIVYLLETVTTNQIFEALRKIHVSLGEISAIEVSKLRASDLHRFLHDELGELWAVEQTKRPVSNAELESRVNHQLAITPYEYQLRGIEYMNSMIESGYGCLLADEMGLGKTAQVIGVISSRSSSGLDFAGSNYLVVVPATLVRNWVREFEKFSPLIVPYVHYGSSRTALPNVLRQHPVVITTYDLLARDELLLQQCSWDLAFFDEAQALKNPTASRTKAAISLNGDKKIVVSGTPFENHMSDIWSLMSIIAPGLLGTRDTFQNEFTEDVPSAQRLSKIISPFVLRRRVDSLPSALPEKSEFKVLLEPDQNTLNVQRQIIADASSENRSKLYVITRLLLAAAHAESLDHQTQAANSKSARLIEVLSEIYENGEKAIVFTPFRTVIDYLESVHRTSFPNVQSFVVDGRSKVNSRQTIIDDFSQADIGVCFLNPTVGGAGLNITSANHVIHFSPLWNPSKRRQATARAYRNGQRLPVFVHNFIYEGTIEEYIWQIQEHKDSLSAGIFEHSDSDFDIEEFQVFMNN